VKGAPLRSLVALGTLLAVVVPSAPAADEFVVIAHQSVLGTSVRRSDLAGVFLRRVQRWGDKSQAVPVDQSATSPVRKAFSESVLKMPTSTALQYWQKQMFATPPLRPPAVKSSDAEVMAFVGSTPGAVGYVSLGAPLTDAVKALAVID
jgi:ABC-type phosphate transport system substrate-binding protein